ncbi:MAG: hypothetical protein ACXWQO_02810 [Bdellovibrionota bacterium]
MDPRIKRLEPAFLFLIYVGIGLLFTRLLTDWVSFVVDEGFTTYGAQRLREGDWPHRDFFFLWTPGILVWHAFLQAMGCTWLGERAAALLAAAFTAAILQRQAMDWKFSGWQRLLLAAGVLLWSFSLWNIPYSSWYALPFALLGARFSQRWPIWAGICFALSFWFKQNIGILAFAGSLVALLLAGEKKCAARSALAFGAGLVVPFTGIFFFGGSAALGKSLWQIFLFPLKYPRLMSEYPPKEWFSTPLMLLGLWILGMFSLQPHLKGSVPRLLRVAMVVFLAYAGFSGGQLFFLGALMLFSLLAWVLSSLLAFTDLNLEERRVFLLFFLPCAGAFLQIFPRVDFQHFLFVFPLALFFLLWSAERLRLRYSWMKGGISLLPVVALFWGGLFFQSRLISLKLYGQKDSLGLVSYGWAHRVNDEIFAVIKLLEGRGLRKGDPVLVLPNAETFYRISGFRNPTPHNQFFPGYVEAFGDKPENVLAEFERAGGRFLVWQYKSGLKIPELIENQIRENYSMVEQFPEHFSVWERKSP